MNICITGSARCEITGYMLSTQNDSRFSAHLLFQLFSADCGASIQTGHEFCNFVNLKNALLEPKC